MAAVGQIKPLVPVPPASGMRTPLFIFGVALALVAFLVMFAFGVVFVGRQQAAGQVQVVVAKSQIDARDPITPDMLTLSPLPASAVTQNTFLHIADVKGMVAAVTIYRGQAISANLVASSPDQISAGTVPYLPIPKGYVAITLPAGEQQAVGGYPNATDYINVIAVINTGQFGDRRARTVVQTVFSNVRIIKIGPAPAGPQPTQTQGVSSSITVVMTECDAEYISWLLANATLKYTLLAKDDYNPAASQSSVCQLSASGQVGPSQVDSRWHFTSA